MCRATFYLLGVLAVLAASAADARAQCMVEVTGISFGTYDVYAASPVFAEGAVTITCEEKERPVEVGVSTGGSGTFFPRRLTAGSGRTLEYNVYLTSTYATIWGDGNTSGTSTRSVTVAKRRPSVLTLFGRIPAAQDVAAGQYADTLMVTVNY